MFSMDKAVLLEVAEPQEGFATLPAAVPALDHLLLLGQSFWQWAWAARRTFCQLPTALLFHSLLQWALLSMLSGCQFRDFGSAAFFPASVYILFFRTGLLGLLLRELPLNLP